MGMLKRNRYKIPDDTFIKVVKSSRSIRQAILNLGLNETGSAYAVFKRRIAKLNLDTSHFAEPKSFLKTHRGFMPAQPLSEILVEHSTYTSSHRLKNRLINEGVLSDICIECQLTHWRGKKLSLHLDHRNGVPDDNRLENLRLLCPNCHSLTDTYAGKNRAIRCRARKEVR